MLKTCPMCRENFPPKVSLTGRRTVQSRAIGVIFCSRKCADKFEHDIGNVDPLLYDFGLPNARVDRRCKDCETPLAPSDPMERCRMCRLTKRIRARFRKEAKRNAAFRAARDAHRVYVRKYGVKPMEEIIE